MRREAKELLALAKGMMAVRSDFTVVKVLQLKREGSTRDSLENARRITAAGYGLAGGTFEFDQQKASWTTMAHFRRSEDDSVGTHIFKGFSFGYSGEGPRGLYEFLNMFGWGPKKDKIMEQGYFPQESGKIRLRDLT